MTPQDLIAAFETLADAPDGTKRLRELVLQLAVRGKLVPQDASDEPARVLLERIAAEKARAKQEKQDQKKERRTLHTQMALVIWENMKEKVAAFLQKRKKVGQTPKAKAVKKVAMKGKAMAKKAMKAM